MGEIININDLYKKKALRVLNKLKYSNEPFWDRSIWIEYQGRHWGGYVSDLIELIENDRI